jgi:hypothetical protein
MDATTNLKTIALESTSANGNALDAVHRRTPTTGGPEGWSQTPSSLSEARVTCLVGGPDVDPSRTLDTHRAKGQLMFLLIPLLIRPIVRLVRRSLALAEHEA